VEATQRRVEYQTTTNRFTRNHPVDESPRRRAASSNQKRIERSSEEAPELSRATATMASASCRNRGRRRGASSVSEPVGGAEAQRQGVDIIKLVKQSRRSRERENSFF